MLQFPGPFPPDTAFPPPGPVDGLVAFVAVYLFILGITSLCLPRPWFVAIFRIAFPFMPERLEDFKKRK